jgi:hypothetical protein
MWEHVKRRLAFATSSLSFTPGFELSGRPLVFRFLFPQPKSFLLKPLEPVLSTQIERFSFYGPRAC